MNRTTLLAKVPVAEILRFDHPPEVDHRDGEPEAPDSYAVSFVDQGPFSVVRHRELWNFQTNDVLLSLIGDHLTYRHTVPCPTDVCLSVHFAPEVVEQALGTFPRRGRAVKIPACDRTIFERFRIEQALRSGEAFTTECAALALIPALLAHTGEWSGELNRTTRFSHYLSRMMDAVELLESQFDRRHSLSDLSRQFAMSPFHFCRIFKGLVGRPLHQFLLEVRLLHASRRLREGDSVTNAALESGFENLSHFIRMFRKRFGVLPGTYRKMRSDAAHPRSTRPTSARKALEE